MSSEVETSLIVTSAPLAADDSMLGSWSRIDALSVLALYCALSPSAFWISDRIWLRPFSAETADTTRSEIPRLRSEWRRNMENAAWLRTGKNAKHFKS